MRFRNVLVAVTTVITLSACNTMQPAGQTGGAHPQNQQQSAESQTQAQQFFSAIEARRGSALSMTERVQIQGLTGSAKAGMNTAQAGFLNRVGAQIGMDGALLAALFPEASKPISESAAISRIERSLGKPLSAADQAAVRSATTLRNNSIASVKTGLAANIGARTGMSTEVVLALMPLLGF
jgi:hypothetical protein